MKKLSIFLLTSSLFIVVASFTSLSLKKPKLAGTSWQQEMSEKRVLDGPSIRTTRTIFFKDKRTVEITSTTYFSSYNAMRMNPDGTVNHIPASSKSNISTGTYKVRKGKVKISIDGKTTIYYIGDNYLSERPLSDIKIMPAPIRDRYIYKKMK
jgi:hypothetical protein